MGGKPVSPTERLQRRELAQKRSPVSSAFGQLQLSCGAPTDRTWRKWKELAHSDRIPVTSVQFGRSESPAGGERNAKAANCYRCACADRRTCFCCGLITTPPAHRAARFSGLSAFFRGGQCVRECASVRVCARGHLSGKTFFPSGAFFLCITKENWAKTNVNTASPTCAIPKPKLATKTKDRQVAKFPGHKKFEVQFTSSAQNRNGKCKPRV